MIQKFWNLGILEYLNITEKIKLFRQPFPTA